MVNEIQPSPKSTTLLDKKKKELRILEIIIWLFTPLSIIALVFVYSPYFLSSPNITYYLFYTGLVLVGIFAFAQFLLGFIRTSLVRNLIIIEGIKFGKKIDQLISIALKTRFLDKISLGRRVYAITALADLGATEALSHLEDLRDDKNPRVRKQVILAVAEIKSKESLINEKIQSDLFLFEPYRDENGQYFSLFDLERGFIKHIIINLLSGLLVMVIMVALVFGIFDLSQFQFSYDYASIIMIFFVVVFYFIFILVLLVAIYIRMNKIKQCLETKDVFTLIQIAIKPGFNLLRYVKMAAISALGDLGSAEAINILRNMGMDRMIDIRSRAMTSLDMISVKNNSNRRFYLDIH
jgi:hypothetical protein